MADNETHNDEELDEIVAMTHRCRTGACAYHDTHAAQHHPKRPRYSTQATRRASPWAA
jgi:hypothetical protein